MSSRQLRRLGGKQMGVLYAAGNACKKSDPDTSDSTFVAQRSRCSAELLAWLRLERVEKRLSTSVMG